MTTRCDSSTLPLWLDLTICAVILVAAAVAALWVVRVTRR